MPYKYGTYGQLGETQAQMGVSTDTLPLYVGTAPINLVRNYAEAGLVNTPIKLRNLTDCQTKIGYSPDWSTYTLCEAMAAHFDNTNGAVGPIYVINVMDPDTHRSAEEQQSTLTLKNGKTELPGSDIILDTLYIPRPLTHYRKNGFVATRAAAEEVFKAYGKDAKGKITYDQVFYHVFDKNQDKKTNYLFVIEAKGNSYACLDLGKNRKDAVSIFAIGLNGGSELTFVDGEKKASQTLDLAGYTGEVTFTVYTCDAESAETYPTNLVEIDRTVIQIVNGDGPQYFTEDEDYSLDYSQARGGIVIEDLTESMPDTITVHYYTVDTSDITAADIIGETTADGECSGIAAIKLLFMEQGAIANILSAPGWDSDPLVYRALVQASKQMNGHWDSVVFVDMPLEDADGNPVDTIEKAIQWKRNKRYEDERVKVFWPQVVDDAGRICHIAPLAVAEAQRIDQSHDGIPYETVGNKPIPMVRQYFGEESTNSGFDQTDAAELTQKGITTVAPWASNWQLWGDHTAAYEYGDDYVDPRSIFDTSIRMLLYITNSFQRQWANEIDKPMTRALKDTILNYEQEKLDALISQGALLPGATVVFSEEDNSTDDLMNGNFTWSIAVTPTPPLKSATVTVAYTDAGFAAYFEEE